jgi:hypothetical protein
MVDANAILDRYDALSLHLDERGRRSFAAVEARAAGHGGIVAVSRATGIAPSTIGRGLKELASGSDLPDGRVRRPGGGRKKLIANDTRLLDDLLALVLPDERGDPMSPLRWTCKSLRRLAAELDALGHRISHTIVGEVLKQQRFSLQANRKTREGDGHPDRDAQFAHINACVTCALAAQQPVISVDTKKKELVGDFKNAGREWRPHGDPEAVRVHDFLIKELGRAVPYGIYDLAANAGWISIGMDHDTSAFAVQTLRTWWHSVGKQRYPDARRLTITADGGGSNGSRVRLWKRELQNLAVNQRRIVSREQRAKVSSWSVWFRCCLWCLDWFGQSRPYPRGGLMEASSSRSTSAIACRASAVAVPWRVSGIASAQAVYSAWSAISSVTASCHLCGRVRRSAGRL